MSRQEPEPSTRQRQRANTASFAPFSWRKTRPEQHTPPPPPVAQPVLSLQGLIDALTPPSVPSLAHARALATTLSNHSPLPRRELLNPLLNALCDAGSPPAVQAAGFDILSAYWENHEATSLGTPERLAYFSLFLGSSTSWAVDLWEPRFKALRALTKDGTEIMGVESNVIDTLQWWIEGAFDGLIKPPSSIERSERTERERSIELIAKFLEDILAKDSIKSRIMDEKMAKVLHFYSGLVDRAISSPDVPRELPPTTPVSAPSANSTPSGRQSTAGHRRNLSSLSSSSSTVPPPPPPLRSAADFATALFLDHVTAQIKYFPPIHLSLILPVLFRALAFCAAPLPRLSVMLQSRKKNNLEDKITEMLSSILSGPYSATSMLVLRQHLFPSSSPQPSRIAIMTSLGAHRTLRNHVRRALCARLARAYISRETSMGYSHSGAPVHLELQVDLMERAWPKDDYTASSVGVGGIGWDAARLGKALAESVGAWIKHEFDDANVKSEEEKRGTWEKEREGKDEILEEAAGILKDILQELDLQEEDDGGMDEEEAEVVGRTLLQLSGYVLPLKNQDGLPFIIPIGHPVDAPTPILRTVSSLLSRDYSRALNPLLSTILIHVAEHLTDSDTSRLPILMMEQQDLSPTSPEWLDNWRTLLENQTLMAPDRPLTRRTIVEALQSVYISVKDMTRYRRPLGDLVASFCGRIAPQSDDADVMWKILGEEIVLRNAEQDDEEDSAFTAELMSLLDLLVNVASEQPPEEEEVESSLETSSINTADTHSPGGTSTIVSPTLSRLHTDTSVVSPHRERDSGLPSVMSILTSLAAGGSSSRSQSMNPHPQDDIREEPEANSQRDDVPLVPRDVSAVAALVEIFCQLTFTPFALQPKNLRLAVRVYEMLLCILSKGKSNRARITALQFLMRLRADRDHRLYFASEAYDPNGLIHSLASLIGRVGDADQRPSSNDRAGGMEEPMSPDSVDIRKARARFPHERDGRQVSSGRGGGGPSRSGASRSRSRAPRPLATPSTPPKPVERLWRIPESSSLPFYVSGPDSPSEVLMSYDPDGPDRVLVLPVSKYLQAINAILERELSWEVLSYVLCHLPVQLANKHLFCGPKSRAAISKMLPILCTGIINGELGGAVESWPPGLKARDAHGLAYQTLSVLISYRRCFDLQQCHYLVEVFQAGLNGQLSTIKCCLHALSLSAFELQPSMTKCLSRILEKLSQIMSNPNMAVHILGFLSIIGSLPALHVNFTEADFKMVFGVALQYLQHYNRLHASSTNAITMSWALSQHVRILSYSAVYIWFLAVKLPDRPRHIRFIARQLLLANEGNEQVDGPTEVCFDWLARYTYASADPRPAHSTFSDIVLSSSDKAPENQKTWILGHSIMTIRALARSGWVEVMSRRPSGFSRFICRIENVPMVGPGDVTPDLLSVPASLIMERNPSRLTLNVDGEGLENGGPPKERAHGLSHVAEGSGGEPPVPDPITGYVWSGTAPSQRRKQVEIDPSFLILQLSPIPDGTTPPFVRRVPDSAALPRFVTTLDRIPVIDTHKVGIMYVAPGQCEETEILRNVHGSPAYTRFLEGIGRLINLRGQMDVYAGGLEPDEDGEYAYAWWDDIGQILYHTATMMPTVDIDPQCNNKKRHIGNDYVRIVWNDSGMPYRFDTLTTQFQFVNIVVEPHSLGSIAAFSNNLHENEYFKVTVQLAPGMTEFAPIGHFKLISAENLPLLVRQLSLLADWFASVFSHTQHDTVRVEMKTNWQNRLEAIRRFKNQLPPDEPLADLGDGVMGQEALRDFTTSF